MPEFPTEESKTDDYVRRTSITSDFSMTTKKQLPEGSGNRVFEALNKNYTTSLE